MFAGNRSGMGAEAAREKLKQKYAPCWQKALVMQKRQSLNPKCNMVASTTPRRLPKQQSAYRSRAVKSASRSSVSQRLRLKGAKYVSHFKYVKSGCRTSKLYLYEQVTRLGEILICST